MKRLLQSTVVVLVVGLLISVGRSGSETNPTPPPRTRTALINLSQVFKGYSKVTEYANANKAMLEPYQTRAKEIQQKVEGLTKELENKELLADKRGQLEKNLKSSQRQMEDLSNEAKELFTKKNEEQMLIVYKEVMAEAQRQATAHGFDLVMHYNDVPTDAPDFYSAGNVSRKIQAGATIPMYIAPGVEITKEVITGLNAKVGKDKKPAEPSKP